VRPWAHQADPMSNEEVRGKFVALTRDAMDPQAQHAYVARVDSLKDEAGCGWLVRAFPAE
jgi:hypothetical protein